MVRLLYGARVSLAVAFGATLINLSIGIALGLAAGYFRGWLDDLVVWVITTLDSIPSLFLLLIVAVLFSPGTLTLVVILGLLRWPNVALFVRGQTLSLREREFVTAGRVLGASHGRLMFGHILPNVVPLVIVVAAIDVGTIILVESALSFLGLGIQPPIPEWGAMVSTARQYLATAPHTFVYPTLAIFVTVIAFNLLGDALRDTLDPTLRA